MPLIRKTFRIGRQNKDIDARILVDGEYRDALNMDISHTENSDSQAVEKSLSNVIKTNLVLGANPITMGGYSDEFRDKLYWAVLSDKGCYLIEYDLESDSSVFVLQDERPLATRVLNFKKGMLITAMEKVISEKMESDLFLMSDDNIEPLCINIERAKKYGLNGFEKEDIYLIKKPPTEAPKTNLVYTNELNNNIEEKFLLFAYRYKYLDKEYSALSSFTNYKFEPKPFKLDYFTNENLGMVNNYSGVRVSFDTGDKRVTDIQVIVKESNSNALYIVETFNKNKEGWENSEDKSFVFSNNKIYVALPEYELYRSFDNVPRKAKSLSMIGNQVVFGNYLEGYNLIDADRNKIKIDFEVSFKSNNLDSAAPVQSVENESILTINNTIPAELTSGKKLIFDIQLRQSTGQNVFQNSYFFILDRDYANLQDVFEDVDFISFIATINSDFINNYEIADLDPDWDLTADPIIYAQVINNQSARLWITDAIFTDELEAIQNIKIYFVNSAIAISDISTSSSLKTERNYEASLIYMDEFGRKTIALTPLNNTLFIPQAYSTFQNRLMLKINNPPPTFATHYKIAVKTQALTYETFIVSKYYNEDLYVWAKLEGDAKDKVKENDVLIIKKSSKRAEPKPLKVKVLEIKVQEKDFITGNLDQGGVEIKEEAGTYMRIKPTNISMDFSNYKIYQSQGGPAEAGNNNKPVVKLSLFDTVDETTQLVTANLAIPQGSSITLYIRSNRDYSSGWKDNILNKEYFAQRDYISLEEWFNENIIGKPLVGNEGNNPQDYQNNISIIQTEVGATLRITGTYEGSASKKGRVDASITVRTTEGFFAFETETKNLTDVGLFYESEETYAIENGNHLGDVDQDYQSFKPAEIELSFFNCYAQGNGIESYKIKDSINKNYLNIDTRPTTTSVEEYSEMRRYADLTYSDTFVESAGINGLNVFNLATANFKELIKSYGSIQATIERDNDLIVFQEEKASTVLYARDAITDSDGNNTIIAVKNVLGRQIPYVGQNGISKNPESIAVDKRRVYYTNSNKGSVIRLSLDGTTEIIYGMVSFFRNLFGERRKSKKLGGFDPYKNQYVLSIEDEPVRTLVLGCDNTLNKIDQEQPFIYNLRINDLGGDIIIGYNISVGAATITAEFDNTIHTVSNVTGIGQLSFTRTSMILNLVKVTITPVDGKISYSLMNICPIGIPIKVVTILLGDQDDLNTNVSNRYRWGTSSIYNYDDTFGEVPVARFTEEIGNEGTGKFPINGSIVNMQAFSNGSYSGRFRDSDCNQLGYLISNDNYTSADVDLILANASFISVSESNETESDSITSGNFVYNRTNVDDVLYMIWDYTTRSPILIDDYVNVIQSGDIVIDVLANDEAQTVDSIVTQPQYGTVVINLDNTINYTHNGGLEYEDYFEYSASNGKCSAVGKVYVTVGLPCTEELSARGSSGIYETVITLGAQTGYAGINFDAISVPDRFQIEYNGVIVADSLYRGIFTGEPPTSPGLLGPHPQLSVFNYNGVDFIDTLEKRDVTVVQEDIAPNPNNVGVGTIYFNKTTAMPAVMKVIATGPIGGTAWNFTSICPQPEIPT